MKEIAQLLDDLVHFLDHLMQPGNGWFLTAFTTLIAVGIAVLIFVIVGFVRKDKLNISFKFLSIWIHFTGGEDDPKDIKNPYRKLLYVKVNLLSNRETHPPFYTRTVDRLAPSDRTFGVYDEATFYTLKLYSKSRFAHEVYTSHGTIEGRLVLPWLSTLGSHSDEGGLDPHTFDIEPNVPSDTICAVSHYCNALQGREQSFSTFTDEDADSLRLVVDFSSIPDASTRIEFVRARITNNKVDVQTDDLKYEVLGNNVYMAHCKSAKKGYLLRMDFIFKDWPATA
jgi:hypothetical protein